MLMEQSSWREFYERVRDGRNNPTKEKSETAPDIWATIQLKSARGTDEIIELKRILREHQILTVQ